MGDRAFHGAAGRSALLMLALALAFAVHACRTTAPATPSPVAAPAGAGAAARPTLHDASAALVTGRTKDAIRMFGEIRRATDSPDTAARAAAGELTGLSVLARREGDPERWREVERLATWALEQDASKERRGTSRWQMALIEARSELGQTDSALEYAQRLYEQGIRADWWLYAVMHTYRTNGQADLALEQYDEHVGEVIASGDLPWAATDELVSIHQELGTESRALTALSDRASEYAGTLPGEFLTFREARLVGDAERLGRYLDFPEFRSAALLALGEMGPAAAPALPALRALREKSGDQDPDLHAWVQSVISSTEAASDGGPTAGTDRGHRSG